MNTRAATGMYQDPWAGTVEGGVSPSFSKAPAFSAASDQQWMSCKALRDSQPSLERKLLALVSGGLRALTQFIWTLSAELLSIGHNVS